MSLSTTGQKLAREVISTGGEAEKRANLVRDLIALIVVVGVIAAAFFGKELNDVPNWLTAIMGTIIGFYFNREPKSKKEA